MAVGTVKIFNLRRGFGFIQPSDGSNDVFVHISAVQPAGLVSPLEEQTVLPIAANRRQKTSMLSDRGGPFTPVGSGGPLPACISPDRRECSDGHISARQR